MIKGQLISIHAKELELIVRLICLQFHVVFQKEDQSNVSDGKRTGKPSKYMPATTCPHVPLVQFDTGK